MLSYYDPTTGQFLTSDPAFTATLSAYGYANNDPINGSDPTGLCFGVCIAIITVVAACIESGWGEDVGGFLGAEGGLSAEAELEASEAAGGIDGGPPCPEYGPPEPAGEPPEAPPATPVRMLTSSEQESIKSLQWQIMEHESKLQSYEDNPDAYDNQGRLCNASSAVRQRVIKGRIAHLQLEINSVRSQIDRIRRGE